MPARHALPLAAAVALSGCIPAYVPPTRDDAATLAFVPHGQADVDLHGFGNGRECRDRVILVPGGLKTGTEIRIPPGDDFTVLAFFNRDGKTCKIALSFLPKPREAYRAEVNAGTTQCGMAILRLDGRSWVPEPTRKRKWHLPFASQGERQCDD